MLGGVEIPHELGLDGHSDADVLMHAIADAMLGAVGRGDIGEHFPNTDEQYRDLAGAALLGRVLDVIEEEGYRVVNVDAMVLAEEPRLTPYKAAMRQEIGRVLGLENGGVNVKAGTNEGMGFVGRKEGIAALANVLLKKIVSKD